ncbi:hypothetical protein [Lunatimonas salinarum]|uniref:hypothetical protein n=1 Tax=Lunatimonas salinarum TaxID=1774590 RepID=UPI001AE092A2|nr:hypothetical protein [Lunatimonas salinarum]
MKTYREQLIDCINELWEARVQVFGCLVSFAMETHLKEIDDAFEIGEVFEFQYAHFEDIDDTNIQRLIALCKEMDETISSLMNINGIDITEDKID